MKDLLRFVCEAEIDGKADDLKEYTIGVEVLGRPAGYSPSEDSSVRSRAYELRRKLEKFYDTEARDAPVRIVMPRGSYIPQFIRSQEELSPTAEVDVVAPAVAGAGADRITRWWLAAAFLTGVVCTLVVVSLWRGGAARFQSAQGWTPDLEAIWKPMIDSKAPILVSFQTRLFFRAGPLSVRDWQVNSVSEVEKSEALMGLKQFLNLPQLYENHNFVDFGAANAVFQLSKLLSARKQEMFARRSVDVTWDDVKRNNVIVIGKPELDPTVMRWLSQGKFQEIGGLIRNAEPAPGEPAEWADGSPGSPGGWAEKYALITMVPGPGDGNWALVMSGSGSEHPWAIAEYLTTPQNAAELVRRLRLPSGKLPKSYQVVIRADFKAQMPVKMSVVALRSLDPP